MAKEYDPEHLVVCRGTFIESDRSRGTFKIELDPKSEMAKRVININKQKVVLEFTYDLPESSRFIHDIRECRRKKQDELYECVICGTQKKRDDKCPECGQSAVKEKCQQCLSINQKNLMFYNFISDSRIGDLINFSAAIIYKDRSVLPVEIYDISNYDKLVVYTAVKDYSRLNDTKRVVVKKTGWIIRVWLAEKTSDNSKEV